jgi:hypothetical protein
LAKDPEPEKTLEELASAYQAQELLVKEHNNRIADFQSRVRDSERSRDFALASMTRLKRAMAEKLDLLPKSTSRTKSDRELSTGELQEIDERMSAATKAVEEA